MNHDSQSDGSEIIQCEWKDIKDFIIKTDVILLDSSLDINTVAENLISDKVEEVKKWLSEKALKKLSDEKNAESLFEDSEKFIMKVVSPFALIKRIEN